MALRPSLCVAMLVLLCYSRLSVAEEPSNAIQSAVVPLSAENYDKVLGSSAISIVYFHNPANATAEEPIQREFEFAAVLLQRMVVFSRVDISTQKELVQLFNVTSTPAMRLTWAGGPVKVYEGDASAKSVVNVVLEEWVRFNKHQKEQRDKLPVARSLSTATEVSRMMSGWPSLIGYFKNPENSTEYDTFQKVAKLYRDNEVSINLGQITNASLLSKLKIERVPSLSLYNPEVGTSWFPSDRDATLSEIVAWVETGRQQMFTQLNEQNVQLLNQRPSAIIFVNVTDQESINHVLGLRDVALKLANNMTFFYADWAKMSNLAYRVGLSPSSKPRFVIWEPSQGLHYNFLPSKPLTAKSVSSFCNDFLGGNLAPSFKSAPRPQNVGDATVIELVTDTFQEVTTQPNADVVVALYSGSSSQSQLLLDLFKKVAESLNHVDRIVFAQMDQDHNDLLPGVPRQIPGVAIFPAGQKKQVHTYSGVATFNGFLHFIETHATASLDESP